VLLRLDEILRVSNSDDDREQKINDLLGVFASTVRGLSDEALIILHREHLKRHAYDLADITRKELDWRGLQVD
jgi:hypothetical protein